MELAQHPSLIAPEVYVWKKRPYGKGRGGRILALHDGSEAWMFWSTYWRENDTRAADGDLFHVLTRINKGGTLNVANITRCNAVETKEGNELPDTVLQASDLEETFEKLAVEDEAGAEELSENTDIHEVTI